MSRTGETIRGLARVFARALGPSRWWPATTPFEVAVGAILTQNANWKNVARAIEALKNAGAMTGPALAALPQGRLEELIRPAGYFRLKATRLRHFLDFLAREADLDMERLRGRDPYGLREDLLQVRGIGRETADSILCYALGMPILVVDAYTVRIFARHGLIPEVTDYEEVREIGQSAIGDDPAELNEFHALMVRAGAAWCAKSRPRCAECPAKSLLPDPERLPE